MNQLKVGFAGSVLALSLVHCAAADPLRPLTGGNGGSAGTDGTGGGAGTSSAAGGSGGASGSPGTGGAGGASTGGSAGTSAPGTGGSTSGGSGGSSGSGTGGSGGAGTGGSAGTAGSSGAGGGPRDAGMSDSGRTGGSAGQMESGAPREGGTGSDAGRPPVMMPGGDAGIGGPSRCAGGNYIICEDFEATAEGAVPAGWMKQGNAAVATDQAARGTHSLKIGAAANGARRISRDATMLGAAHWGRIFYRVQLPVPTVFVHSTLVGLQGVGPMGGSGEYRVVDTVKDAQQRHQFLYNVQPSGAEFGKGSAYNWMFDGQWHCAEWSINNADQSYHFYFDGTEITQIAIMNGAGRYAGSDIPPVFSQVRVGWNNYQSAAPGFVAWIDEVALHTTRIGCGN